MGGNEPLGARADFWTEAAWQNLTRLQRLNVNRILRPDGRLPSCLRALPQLQELTIYFAKITQLTLADFLPIPQLHTLSLEGNDIAVITSDVVAELSRLTRFNMTLSSSLCVLNTSSAVGMTCHCAENLYGAPHFCAAPCTIFSLAPYNLRFGNTSGCDPAHRGVNCSVVCGETCIPRSRGMASCQEDGTWATNVHCDRCDEAMDASPASSPLSGAGLYALAGGLVAVAMVIAASFVVFRRRQRRRERVALQQQYAAVLFTCVNTSFSGTLRQLHSGPGRLVLDGQATLAALEVPREAVLCERLVGEGAFGQVWYGVLADRKGGSSNQAIAVKQSRNTDAEAQVQLLLEARTLQMFPHPHIVAIYGVVASEAPVLMCIEYMTGGDARTFLRRCRPACASPLMVLAPEDFARWASHVASAMAFLATHHIVHRDLAARNVLLTADGSVAKLGDLGLVRGVRATEQAYVARHDGEARLPMAWMAPEALCDHSYSQASDVWSFGVLLWEFTAYGRTPYGALGAREIVAEVCAGRTLAQPAACPGPLWTLVLDCWAMDRARRPSFADLAQRLTAVDAPVSSLDLVPTRPALAAGPGRADSTSSSLAARRETARFYEEDKDGVDSTSSSLAARRETARFYEYEDADEDGVAI